MSGLTTVGYCRWNLAACSLRRLYSGQICLARTTRRLGKNSFIVLNASGGLIAMTFRCFVRRQTISNSAVFLAALGDKCTIGIHCEGTDTKDRPDDLGSSSCKALLNQIGLSALHRRRPTTPSAAFWVGKPTHLMFNSRSFLRILSPSLFLLVLIALDTPVGPPPAGSKHRHFSRSEEINDRVGGISACARSSMQVSTYTVKVRVSPSTLG
ncbi:hypothetical protein B0H16DRAFT_874492 [Mycena metata]|uniref:Uncharacterized protein n=1 Tax=Mycena metata TaxID=1033252 RepID=A0AAD7N7Z4_9AGAR|nr:hypothetical protein B0H16DRAFT_874492 [Mycena metata]